MIKRSEQPVEYTWDLGMMYDPSNLDKDLKKAWELVEMIKLFKGKQLNELDITSALKLSWQLSILLENIYVYFSHQQDTDYSNAEYVSILNKVKGEVNNIQVEVSFLKAEIAKVDNSILEAIINDDSLEEYHQTIRKIIDNKKRYLSVEQEKIISQYGLVDGAAYNLYSAFTNSDLKFDDVLDKKGNKHPMSEGIYSNYIRSNDRTLRKNAFDCLFNTYGSFNQTLATNYISEIKQDIVSMKNRNYDSTLQQALEPNQIPLYVYYNLLESIENNIQVNYNYLDLRKREMKLDELHLYDVYVPMVEEVDKKYPYEEGRKLCEEALQVFGEEYSNIITEAFEKRWIDVYENEGKRTGAYSGGSYTSAPYILLNYHNQISDVFTLAHELGHSMHTYYANKFNNYGNANYKIFIAEVASTVNELILINNLLSKENDIKIQKYLLNYLLEQFRTTVIRQTMFARFELDSHQLVEQNKPVSNEVLNDLYYDINRKYFGRHVVLDENIKYEWSRIPHFYYNYYVYQYATCFSIALNVVERILKEEDGFVEKYINFLKLGDSVYPIDALKTIDIDLSNSDVFDEAMKKYQDTIDQYIKLC